MKKIKEDIASRTFETVYLLTGPEGYLRQNLKQALRQALAEEDGMNYTYREGKETDVSELIGIAETLPFFAEKRLILVENSGLFKRGGDELAEYLPQTPDFTVWVFNEEEVDKRSRLYKAADKCGHVVECARLGPQDLESFVLKAFAREKQRVTKDAMELFLERCGDDLGHLVTEQEKLSAYCLGRDVRLEDVEAVTSVTAQNRVFDMLDAIAQGKPREAFRLYEDMKALREPPMRILYLLTQQVNRLLQVKELDKQGLREGAIAEATGMRPFVVKKSLRQAQAFTVRQLRGRLERMAELDAAIKNGELEDALALETVLAEFAGKYD